MLNFENVSCQLGEHLVLTDISLHIRSGELAVMLGPSGVGKTTLLRLASGLLHPDGGRISNGFRCTSMVFQEPRLLPWLSARENVSLVMAHQPAERKIAFAQMWLRRVGLDARLFDKSPAELSGGQRQRVALARAFAVHPDLILMDEPFSALDLGARQTLQHITRQLAVQTGIAILFVTHDVPEAVRLADRLLVLDGPPGRLAADLPHSPVSQPEAIWQAAAALVRKPDFASLLQENVTRAKSEMCSVFNKSEVNTTNGTSCDVVY